MDVFHLKFIFHNNCDNCKGSGGFNFSKCDCDIGIACFSPQILYIGGVFHCI